MNVNIVCLQDFHHVFTNMLESVGDIVERILQETILYGIFAEIHFLHPVEMGWFILELLILVLQFCKHVGHSFSAFITDGSLQSPFRIINNKARGICYLFEAASKNLPPDKVSCFLVGGSESQICFFEERVTEHGKLFLYVANHAA